MTINYVFTGIAVSNYNLALAWYERFFGRPPAAIVTENEAMWQVADAGWIYVVGDANRSGKALLTLLVDNLDGYVAEFNGRGIETSPINIVPGLHRKAVIIDPEGNMISFGQDLSTDD